MKRSSPADKKEPRGPRDVDAYLAPLPAEARTTLQKIRKAIRAAAPRAEEGISYGLPTIRLEGRPIVWYAAFKNHCSFYPGSAVLRRYARELKAYETSKGTIRFSSESPLPSALVQKLVKARIADLRKPKK
jgi:uncharacterized protein YdhG (YjbR/CyaY superfamily)